MRPSLPVDVSSIRLLGALQGAPLSCLVALYLVHPQPVGRSDLAMMTAYGVATITRAMDKLVNVYHLAARMSRYESWCLTEQGVQLRLPFFGRLFPVAVPQLETRAPREDSILALDGSSSSSLLTLSDSDLDLKTTTTPEREDSILALPPEALELIEIYLRGCNRAASTNAVRTALERGDTLKDIESEMILWVSYAESPLGKGIRGPAVLAASKIKAGEKCPDFLWRVDTNDRKTGAAWGRWKDAQAPWLERLDELWETKPRSGLIQMSDAMRRAMEQREDPTHES